MKRIAVKITLSILTIIIVSSGALTQITTERGQSDVAKTVVMRDIKLINDPTFVAHGHRQANVQEPNEEPDEKIIPPRFENPFEASIVAPVAEGTDQRYMINESPCLTYQGMRIGTFIPPDVAGAVGHDHIFLTENDSFRIQDKYGTILHQQLHQDGASIWSGLYSNNLFDPKLIYDPYANRWIHVICADSQSGTSALLIAVSANADPTGTWNIWAIDVDAENDQWFDYPSLGFNNKWLIVNGMMFPTPGSMAANVSRTFAFQLSQLYAGNTVNWSVFSISGYSHIIPALTYDTGMNDVWCVTNESVNDNDLRYFRISGGASTPAMTQEGFISINPNWGSGGADIAPQSGSTVLVNAGDHRLLSAMWRNGHLYTSQTVFLPSGGSPTTCTIQFVVSTPATATVNEAIRFTSSATSMYAFPNLVVNANSDIIISCARFSTSIFPSACVLVRRNGNPAWFESIYKAGEDWYVNYDSANPPRNRWGDYTIAAIDPSDDQSVWVLSEYSRPQNGPTAGAWGTWWAKICTGVCPTMVTVNTVQVGGTMKKYEASDVVLANNYINVNTYIKLDAGNRVLLQPGFVAWNGSRVWAFIEGCVGPQ